MFRTPAQYVYDDDVCKQIIGLWKSDWIATLFQIYEPVDSLLFCLSVGPSWTPANVFCMESSSLT